MGSSGITIIPVIVALIVIGVTIYAIRRRRSKPPNGDE
jgi:hypothetical protein